MHRKHFFLMVIGCTIILLDQITKSLVQSQFELHESMIVIDGFFALTYIQNPGAAFGFMAEQGAAFRGVFFTIISIIALILLSVIFRQTPNEDTLALIAVSLLFGGAIGNMIDRIRLGKVVDFLDFFIGRHHWPAFNVADSSITVGVSLMMFHLFLQKKQVTQEPDGRD
ncbi:MAG: signal peptidase II [Nitrospiria bacterium]